MLVVRLCKLHRCIFIHVLLVGIYLGAYKHISEFVTGKGTFEEGLLSQEWN